MKQRPTGFAQILYAMQVLKTTSYDMTRYRNREVNKSKTGPDRLASTNRMFLYSAERVKIRFTMFELVDYSEKKEAFQSVERRI